MNFYSKINKYKERIISIAFSGLAIVVAALLATGFDFKWENLLDVAFYVRTLTNYVLMLVIFNSSMNDTINLEKTNENGELTKCKKRTERKVKIVRDEHLENLIDEKAKEESERRRINACNKRLNHHTYGLELKDGVVYYGVQKQIDGTYKELTQEEFFESRHLSKRKIKKVKKDITLALNSQVEYVEITGFEILTGFKGSDTSKCNDAQMSFDENKEKLQLNLKKTISFLLIAALLEIFGWDSINYKQFLISVLTHATVIVGAIMSGFRFGLMTISKLVIIETNRAAFLNQAIPKETQDKYLEDGTRNVEENKQNKIANLKDQVVNMFGENQNQIKKLDSNVAESNI